MFGEHRSARLIGISSNSGTVIVRWNDAIHLVCDVVCDAALQVDVITGSRHRQGEVNDIATWVEANNLSLNSYKSKDIVLIDPKRKRQCLIPTTLPGIVRDTSVKILCVDITNGCQRQNMSKQQRAELSTRRVLRAHSVSPEEVRWPSG